jgi:type III restriction enzyme
MSQDFEVESPILNSPFVEPRWHWVIEKAKPPTKADGRRRASYFYRVPEHAGRGRKSKTQQEMAFEADKGQEFELGLVNDIRRRVGNWRRRNLQRGPCL